LVLLVGFMMKRDAPESAIMSKSRTAAKSRLHDWPPLASVAWNAPTLNDVAETERDAFHLG
jgi:hypothetical protein